MWIFDDTKSLLIIFISFFTENEELIERFRDTSGKFNLSRLHQHPAQMLNLYGTLIESGLNDSGFVSGTMTEISQRHKQSNVPFEDIKVNRIFCYYKILINCRANCLVFQINYRCIQLMCKDICSTIL